MEVSQEVLDSIFGRDDDDDDEAFDEEDDDQNDAIKTEL